MIALYGKSAILKLIMLHIKAVLVENVYLNSSHKQDSILAIDSADSIHSPFRHSINFS